MNKIYCINCKYCEADYIHFAPLTGFQYNYCKKPSAKIGTEIIPESSIYPERVIDVYEEAAFKICQIINENNDCKYFEEKVRLK